MTTPTPKTTLTPMVRKSRRGGTVSALQADDISAATDRARGYTDADLAEVSDNPPWTDAEIAAARPFADVFPAAAAAIRRSRGPQKAPTKVKVTLRLDHAVLEHFKATGRGWQGRIDAILKRAAGTGG